MGRSTEPLLLSAVSASLMVFISARSIVNRVVGKQRFSDLTRPAVRSAVGRCGWKIHSSVCLFTHSNMDLRVVGHFHGLYLSLLSWV